MPVYPVELEGVRKVFTRRDKQTRKQVELAAVDGVTFTLACGEIFGLLGPNGAEEQSEILFPPPVAPPWEFLPLKR